MKYYNCVLISTLVLATAFIFGCGGGAATNANANKTNAPANANANKPANTTAAATPAASNTDTASNPDLDFTLINKTGYGIKKVYIGPTSTKDWVEDEEILKGRSFADGATMDVKFHPKATAEVWDLKVEWTDGSPSEEWLKLNLTKIEKVTLKYDKAADKTTAEIE